MRFRLLPLVAFLCFSFASARAQTSSKLSVTSKMVIEKEMRNYHYVEPGKRKALSFKNKSFIYKINPVSYISIGLMFWYQRSVSQQLQAECNYEKSCSQYTKHAVEKFGLFKGVFLGFYQLQNCHSTTTEDYPNYKLTENWKIKNDKFPGEEN